MPDRGADWRISSRSGAWSSNYFLSNENTLIVLRQVSINGILAIGMTFVIITAGVDLSVGSVLALSGIVAARFATNNSGLAIGDTATAVMAPLIVALGIGIVCGLVNGTVLAVIGCSRLSSPWACSPRRAG